MKDQEYQHILFDLDGTITDPMKGITKSVSYALASFGIEVEDRRTLCPFIGPPLKNSFIEYFNFTEEQAEAAIVKYREYFSTKGIFENYMYKGMDEFLWTLILKGKKIYLATSKPEPFAKQILEHFKLDSYFTLIGGSNFDGSQSEKADVINHVLGEAKIRAKINNIEAVGVLYGYGNKEEFQEAGADFIVSNLQELLQVLLAMK